MTNGSIVLTFLQQEVEEIVSCAVMQLSVQVDNNGEPVVQLTTIVQLTRSTPRTFHNIRRHLRASHRIGVSSGNATLRKRPIMPSRIRGRSQYPCSWCQCINMIRKSIMLRSRRDSWKDKYGGLGSYFRCHLTLPGPWRGKTGDTWFIIRWRPTDTSETTWSVSVDTWGDVCGSLDQVGIREATFDQLKMAHCTGIGEVNLMPGHGYQPPHKITLHPRYITWSQSFCKNVFYFAPLPSF